MSGSILTNQGRISATQPFYIPYADNNYMASSFTIATGGGISFYNISTPTLRTTGNTPTFILSPSQNGSAIQSAYVSSFGNNISNGYIRIAPTNSNAFVPAQTYPYKYTILNQ